MFALRRGLKIYPAFYVFLIATLALRPLFLTEDLGNAESTYVAGRS